MSLNIYSILIDSSKFDNIDFKLLSYVSKERQAKIERYRFISDKKLSLYSGLLVRMELSNFLNVSHNQLDFSINDFQKPILLNYPQIDFSISHTKGFILCAITNNGKIGVDVEKISHMHKNVMKRVFCQTEIDYVLQSQEMQSERFFKVWTRKEAYSKYLGCGLCEEVFKTNTLEPKFEYNNLTLKNNDFICSIFSQDVTNYKILSISEDDIIKFFLK